MGRQRYSEGANLKDKKTFASFLAEDEELILASGYSKNFLRHRFVLYTLIPGAIFMLLGFFWAYLTKNNLGHGLLFGLSFAIIFALLKTIWTYHAHRYLLTTRRVIIKDGFFAVKLTSALFDKVTHIEVRQTLFDRLIMRHGSIIINTAGGNKDEIKLQYIDSPIEFKNLLERLINREREQFGRPTGPVVALEGEVVE